jgi:DNA-directed RNA polymerase specialized sigma24 family protein
MSDVTRILSAIQQGDPQAAEQLLPLVYDELRRLAAQRMALEKPGQTLQATALVHEAYLRLVAGDSQPLWDGRGHFFAAAAEAMRRILIDQARRRKSQKAGGQMRRGDVNEGALIAPTDDLLITLGVGVAASAAIAQPPDESREGVPKAQVLATKRLEDHFTASPAISNGRIYLRGFDMLYAIGSAK